MGRAKAGPGRGDLVRVDWVDILEDGNGDPKEARLARRTSYGIYWSEAADGGIPCIVTTTTIDEFDGQQGYCIYPKACVVAVRIIRRNRRKHLTD